MGSKASAFIIVTSLWLSMSASFAEEVLSTQTLMDSIKQFHPKLQEVAAKRSQAELEEMRALGAFDPVVYQSTALRPSGYYDGQFLEQKVEKRLTDMNARIFGGYRISDGDFPEYEGEMRTLSGGEANVGVAFSLLQNRETDKYRTALQNALAARENWLARESAQINSTLYKGLSAMLDWYQASLQYKVIMDLVTTTEDRLEGIRTRVENGDLAAISLTEFNATLLSRRLALQRAERELAVTKQVLVFYWRDSQGQMRPIEDIPKAATRLTWPFTLHQQNSAELKQQVYQHPAVQALQAERVKARNDERLKANQLLPKLDLELKVARDLGAGSETLVGTESKVGLTFSLPLGQRTAKAERFSAQQKIKELEFALTNLINELERDMAVAMEQVNYGKQMLALNQQQAEIAEKLLEQEFVRFRAGASDLFLLNNREALAIQAKLASVQAQVQLYKQELSVWAAAGALVDFTAVTN